MSTNKVIVWCILFLVFCNLFLWIWYQPVVRVYVFLMTTFHFTFHGYRNTYMYRDKVVLAPKIGSDKNGSYNINSVSMKYENKTMGSDNRVYFTVKWFTMGVEHRIHCVQCAWGTFYEIFYRLKSYKNVPNFKQRNSISCWCRGLLCETVF